MSILNRIVVCLALLMISRANAADRTCSACHAREAASQPQTPMAHALLDLKSGGDAQLPSELTAAREGYVTTVKSKTGQLNYSVSDGKRTIEYPIRWVFGYGSQTYLIERDGRFIESLFSYYGATRGLDVTIGDESLHPKSIDEAVGRVLEPAVVQACFECHSTRAAPNHALHLASLIPGVTCERCHTNAAAHLASIGRDRNPAVPDRLGKLSSESISNFCGQCHRSWETVVRNNWRGESNVRFQPYRLANSRCFNGTDARIDCVACHNPHEQLVTNASAYDAKCLACHAGKQTKVCPVAQSDCVTCHMPKVQLPGGHKAFTDHQIRIVKAGESYPN